MLPPGVTVILHEFGVSSSSRAWSSQTRFCHDRMSHCFPSSCQIVVWNCTTDGALLPKHDHEQIPTIREMGSEWKEQTEVTHCKCSLFRIVGASRYGVILYLVRVLDNRDLQQTGYKRVSCDQEPDASAQFIQEASPKGGSRSC